MSRTLPTIRVRPIATSTDNPVRRSRTLDNALRVRHSEFTSLYHPSATLEVRCASSTFNITYLANRSSCRSYLRRCCTSTSLQSFLQSCRGVKSTALSSIYKLPPGSVVPSWIVAELSRILFDGFDVNRHSASVSGRTPPVV